jgi:succinate-acetate transporter protein
MEHEEKDFGLLLAVFGLSFVLLSLLLYGLTTADGVDWLSVVTAVGGFALLITGLYRAFRHKGAGSAV